MCDGEVGNFVMMKKWSLHFYISNDNVTLTDCFYEWIWRKRGMARKEKSWNLFWSNHYDPL